MLTAIIMKLLYFYGILCSCCFLENRPNTRDFGDYAETNRYPSENS